MGRLHKLDDPMHEAAHDAAVELAFGRVWEHITNLSAMGVCPSCLLFKIGQATIEATAEDVSGQQAVELATALYHEAIKQLPDKECEWH